MSISAANVLSIFIESNVEEIRYRDLIRALGVSVKDRTSFRHLLSELVRSDYLRLRKGRFYRLGKTPLPKGLTATKEPVSTQKQREILFHGLCADEGIPLEFSKATIKETEELPSSVEALPEDYEDLQHLPFVTIDPASAKDFDDAVCALEREDGQGIRLAVAIADVAHYVLPHQPLDRDALMRGTSVYVPGSVFPMLPHALSNGLCSLRPNEKRLAMVAFIDYDWKGNTQRLDFKQALIFSRARLSYEQAQDILKGADAEPELRMSFNRMQQLSKLLQKKAISRGALDLDIPEAKVIIDKSGEIANIVQSSRLDAHRLIEVFMIEANQAVATYLTDHEFPCIFRVHDRPDAEALESFAETAKSLGHAIKSQKPIRGTELNRFLSKLQSSEDRNHLNILLLRSMKQAMYSTTNIGHFGLALENYCHFTSPIRRYPDLIVHRLLKQAMTCPDDEQTPIKGDQRYASLAEQCSSSERRAITIERKAISICQAEFMASKIGEEYDATISGVLEFGFFVQISEPFVEGLVHVSKLASDYFIYQENEHALVGQRSEIRYRLGDPIRVKLIRVDIPKGQIDFCPAGDTDSEPTDPHRRRYRRPAIQKPSKTGKAVLRKRPRRWR